MFTEVFSYVVGAVGAVGAVVGVTGVLSARRDQRRVRPVVVVHEDQGRTLREDGEIFVSLHLTYESAASAFNIRYGINLAGTDFPWRHSDEDAGGSRLNVLRPGARYPGKGSIDQVIPDAVGWGWDEAPDLGRYYWATYESAAGEHWRTQNPATRWDDLIVTPIRSKGCNGSVNRGD